MGTKSKKVSDKSELVKSATEMARRTQFNFCAHYYQGIAYFELGKFKEAASEFEEAVRLEPLDYSSRYRLGTTYYHLGRDFCDGGLFCQAAEYFEEVIKVDPYFADPYNYLSEIYIETGTAEERLWAAKKAVELSPNHVINPWVYDLIGTDYMDKKDFKSAMEQVGKLARLDKSMAWNLLKEIRFAEESMILKDDRYIPCW